MQLNKQAMKEQGEVTSVSVWGPFGACGFLALQCKADKRDTSVLAFPFYSLQELAHLLVLNL